MNKIQIFLTCLLLVATSSAIFSQEYSEYTLRDRLDSISVKSPGYNGAVQLNVSGLPLSELVNTIALENNLNITIDPSLNQSITYNFFDAQVKDVLVFLYQNFMVEYQFVGNILVIKKRTEKREIAIPPPPKKIDVKYNPSNEFLSVDLKNDSLFEVVKEITKLSGNNIVMANDVRDKAVSAYFLNRPIAEVIQMISQANGLDYKLGENGIHYIFNSQNSGAANGAATSSNFKPANSRFEETGVQITKNKFGTLDIVANNADLADIIQLASKELNAPYFFYNKPEGKSSFEIINTTFPNVLDLIFKGTKYSYKEEDRLFLIGENSSEGIRVAELIRMENRTIENVKVAIPKDLTIDLEINEFPELNGLIVTGPKRKVTELKNFLSMIDVVVPMVQMDVLIIVSDKTNSLNSGIKAGLKDQPTVFTGDVFPELDVNLGSQVINSILNGISGFGIVNLGNVTSNFYMSLKLLESNGVIQVESTPKITTLSGHLATVSIGQTTYYQEQRVDVQNTVVNQGVLTSKIWKSVDASLIVKIKPFVSADDNVTLSITVTNDDFGARIDPTAPPNATKQTFESMVRVKNGEVILLGGLEKKQDNNSGSGVPLISRIPVLRWFFSSRIKSKQKYKLHVILRPTVTY
jgi:type IV pilus assembly protein PilQ